MFVPLTPLSFVRRDLSSLEPVTIGGGPCPPPEMVWQAEATLGCRVTAGCGLSETVPVRSAVVDKGTLWESQEDRMERQASAGLPGIDIAAPRRRGRETRA